MCYYSLENKMIKICRCTADVKDRLVIKRKKRMFWLDVDISLISKKKTKDLIVKKKDVHALI